MITNNRGIIRTLSTRRSTGAAEAPIGASITRNRANKKFCRRTSKKKEKNVSIVEKKSVKTKDPFKLMIKIIRVISPDTIYLADPSNDASFERMTAEMQKFYTTNAQVTSNNEWEINNQCAVYFARDKSYRRGKIIEFESTEAVKVFLYDLSLTEIIPVTELQALKKEFWATRAYTFKVKLAGVHPCGGSSQWPAGSCAYLQDIIVENEEATFYISKVNDIGKDDLDVELWIEQVKIDGPLAPARTEIKSVNRMLVDKGLALPLKLCNEKRSSMLATELKRHITYADYEQKAEEKKSYEKFDEEGKTTDSETLLETDSDENSSTSSLNKSSNHEGNETVVNRTWNEDPVAGRAVLASTEKPTSWLPAEPIEEDLFRAVPTNLDIACSLYLHSVHQNGHMLQYIEQTLAKKYDNTVTQDSDLVWEEGELCIAQYHANNKWYRAQVCRVLDNKMIEIEFIDYGNVEECENHRLRKDVTLANIPRQSTKCVISGLHPNTKTGEWSISDLDQIHALLVDHECSIAVLKREPDHLVVSVILATPRRCELIKYLRDDMHMNVRAEREKSRTASGQSDTTTDEDQDLSVNICIKKDEYSREFENKNVFIIDETKMEKVYSSDDEEIIEKTKNEDCKGSVENCNESVKNFNESIDEDTNSSDKVNEGTNEGDNYEETELIGMDSSEYAKTPVCSPNLEGRIFANEGDLDMCKDNDNLTYIKTDDIIAGTTNFTCDADEIDNNQRGAMTDADSISLPDTITLREGNLVASTPHNATFDAGTDQWRPVKIPENVTVVKAEVGKIGVVNLCVHLLDNNDSEVITDQREQYNRMMLDMQIHAVDQPVLKHIEKDLPCCARFIDGIWYRCRVLDHAPEPYTLDQPIRVLFVDYGNEGCVEFDKVRVLKDEWFEAPCMSLCCTVANMTLAPVDDIEKACEKICSLYVKDTEYQDSSVLYVKIEGRSSDTYDVEIYRDEACTDLAYQSIIDEGLYVKTTDL